MAPGAIKLGQKYPKKKKGRPKRTVAAPGKNFPRSPCFKNNVVHRTSGVFGRLGHQPKIPMVSKDEADEKIKQMEILYLQKQISLMSDLKKALEKIAELTAKNESLEADNEQYRVYVESRINKMIEHYSQKKMAGLPPDE